MSDCKHHWQNQRTISRLGNRHRVLVQCQRCGEYHEMTTLSKIVPGVTPPLTQPLPGAHDAAEPHRRAK